MIALAAVGQVHSIRQSRIKQVATGFVLAAALRLGGLALNNIVVTNAAAVPLLYGLPLGAILASAWVIGRSQRRLRPEFSLARLLPSFGRRPLGALAAVPGGR